MESKHELAVKGALKYVRLYETNPKALPFVDDKLYQSFSQFIKVSLLNLDTREETLRLIAKHDPEFFAETMVNETISVMLMRSRKQLTHLDSLMNRLTVKE